MLAIVIPYYKLTYFEKTLQSLANQTDKRFKVYIGDDASTESPIDLLEKYKGQFDFVYHLFESNLGGISLTKQWDRCIALSGDEEWLMILGDDDYLETNVIASWYKYYGEFYRKSNVIRFASKSVNMKLNGIISNSFTHPVLEKATDSYYRRFKGLTRSTLSEYVFSKASFLKYGFHDFPLAWHSDDAAWLDFSNNKPIYTINESNVFVRFSDSSISGNYANHNLKYMASEQYFKYVTFHKLRFFKKKNRLELLMAYEVRIKNNRKLDLKDWFSLMNLYLMNFKFVPFVKYTRRFLISLIYQ
ncbi:glycosyltransferase family A protein [Flavobacterium sp. RSP29]|uniref:glycosyltransferase family A protein n=1 Tax=Flavobacterium sp. RSP29 TaxID=3401731 RepID=UPI003AB0E1E9